MFGETRAEKRSLFITFNSCYEYPFSGKWEERKVLCSIISGLSWWRRGPADGIRCLKSVTEKYPATFG